MPNCPTLPAGRGIGQANGQQKHGSGKIRPPPPTQRRRDSSPVASAISSFLAAAEPSRGPPTVMAKSGGSAGSSSALQRHSLQSIMGSTDKGQGQQTATGTTSMTMTGTVSAAAGSSSSANNVSSPPSTHDANFPRLHQNRRHSQSQEHLNGSGGSSQRATPSMMSSVLTARLDSLAYLGCSTMDNPMSEAEMLSIVATLNAEKAHDAVPVSLIVPGSATGFVRLMECTNEGTSDKQSPAAEICSFPVNRIRFCARGKPNSAERGCFALSFTQLAKGSTNALHQCHVFRCQKPEQAAQALFCFAQAFRAAQQQKQQEEQQQRVQKHRNSMGNQEAIGTAASISSPTSEAPTIATTTIDDNHSHISISSSESSTILIGQQELYEFEALLEIKERENTQQQQNGNLNGEVAEQQPQQQAFGVCPLERNCFKMRRDREKRVVVMLKQTAGPRHLRVKNCFGLLLAAGRNLQHSDMHLLEIQSATEGQYNPQVFIVEARWNPSAQNFEVLNTETPRDTRVFMTIAVDVIFEGLNESIRFELECKARIFQQFERFWSPQRRAMSETYTLLVQKMMDEQASTSSADSGICYADPTAGQTSDKIIRKVVRFESATERQRKAAMAAGGMEKSPSHQMPTQLIHPADDDESDCDEPLLSGSGEVCQECSEDRLSTWREMVEQWKGTPEKRPEGLNSLIHDGIPDVMRGEVWLLLARVGAEQADLVQTYQMLLEKECPADAVILRDIHRTFPAHDYFKDADGEESGQKALYRISKAYSLYDEEVGYCQGLSFLAAALLLHMPEELAFCVLVRIMHDYGMRALFKTGFDALHLRFYQLQRLVKDYAHELYAHFNENGVETHMYASQWFLTLFTAKFPLQMVFFIVDLFLTEGMNTIFHISLALLQDSKKELLQADFEGILKFFRVNLPRKYRTEANAKELIHAAVKLKISHKRLAKYENEWHEMKQREIESQDPLERLQRENCRLKEQILRLERENDDLAHQLMSSKIGLQTRLDMTEDQLETTLNQVVRKSRECAEFAERESQLRDELEFLKQKCRMEVGRLEEEQRRSDHVIAEYKRICTELGLASEQDKRQFRQQKRIVAARILGCDRCATQLADWIGADSPTPQRPRSAMSNGSGTGAENGGSVENLAANGSSALHMVELVERLQQREDHIRQVELELAQTKLALVESQCQNQDLTHQMSTSINNGDSTRPAWLKKTISSLREVAAQATQSATAANTLINPMVVGDGSRWSSSNASTASSTPTLHEHLGGEKK